MDYKGKLYGKIGNKYFDTSYTSDDWDRLNNENTELKKQCVINGVVKPFTYNDICKVAEELANDYSSDRKDPVWRDIRQDGIKAIQAFAKKHL